jgi:hypothetical protein
MMMVVMGHECERGTVWRDQLKEGGGKEGILRVKRTEIHCIHTYEGSTMKSTKPCVKRVEEKGGMGI